MAVWRASSPVRQHAIPRRKNTPAQPAFPYIFASALRAAGESMEAAPSSCARHSYTVNLLSKSPVGSPSGTACSRGALPMCLLEGRHRRRLRLGLGGCFAFFVAYESIRCRHVACHGSANRSLPPSPRAASQPGWPAQEVHVGRSTSSRFATDLAVLYGSLCSHARVPLGRCR